MRIHVYSFAWNEARLVPFFLRHYGPEWVERITVFDNCSTDATVALLAADRRVEIRPFNTHGILCEEALRRLRDSCWKESRGAADWCAIVDFDEFLWTPGGMPALLARMEAEGVLISASRGRQMVARTFPVDDGRTQLVDLVRQGVAHAMYGKVCLLRPSLLARLGAGLGLHTAAPVDLGGRPVPIVHHDPLCLHFRALGLDYLFERSRSHRERLPAADVARGWDGHLRGTEDDFARRFETLLAHAFDVIAWEERYQAAGATERPAMYLPAGPPDDCLL